MDVVCEFGQPISLGRFPNDVTLRVVCGAPCGAQRILRGPNRCPRSPPEAIGHKYIAIFGQLLPVLKKEKKVKNGALPYSKILTKNIHF